MNNEATIGFAIPPLQVSATASVSEIIDAMEVIGFQDQSKEKVAEVIQEKFQDLILGKTEVIPSEFIEYTDTIMAVIEYLSKIAT